MHPLRLHRQSINMGRLSISAMQGRTTSALSERKNEKLKEKNSLGDTSEKLVKKNTLTNKKIPAPAIDQKMNKILKSTMNSSSVSKNEAKTNAGSVNSKMQQVLGSVMKKKVSAEGS